MTRPFRGYQAYSGDTALVLGGISNSQSDEKTQDVSDDIPLPGLLALNMTTKTFTNSTARSFNRGRSAVVGRMQYVPSFGPDGLFMAMGGSMIPVVTEGLISFGNIWVYQAETNTWFNQTARGNLPGPRKDFCLAGANSTNGTYEIFLYGGQNGNLGPEAVPYDEIYILTLPAFSWLKVDYPPEHPRHGHTCEHVGGSQIVSIGGLDSNSRVYYGDYSDIDKSTFNSSADPFAQGLGIFDMTTLTWADHYSANPPAYEQSELVRNFYSQNPQDGSQFTDAGLRDLFQVTHFNQETPAATTSSPTPELSSSSSSSSSNTGAIAGGVVGGIGGIALVAGAAFFLLRRKRGRYAKTTGSSTPDLQGNGHPLQEVDGNKPAGYHELSPQHLAEMEEARPEMGHDEAGGVYGRPPLEMEAREVGKGRGG
ncbi:MAG: hypothetical protein LQ343_000001 [Gyalolechia ehrenbergii]|nr:MAG: hypothetical protein LQ343_000001 [Gyalolechia ehrenbergii]